MVKEKIQRTILIQSVPFSVSFTGVKVKAFFVKNLSDNDLYVSFAPISNNTGIKIPPKTAQLCVSNLALDAPDNTGTEVLYLSGIGEVEVQAIWY